MIFFTSLIMRSINCQSFVEAFVRALQLKLCADSRFPEFPSRFAMSFNPPI
jgi:hypothetical protein